MRVGNLTLLCANLSYVLRLLINHAKIDICREIITQISPRQGYQSGTKNHKWPTAIVSIQLGKATVMLHRNIDSIPKFISDKTTNGKYDVETLNIQMLAGSTKSLINNETDWSPNYHKLPEYFQNLLYPLIQSLN